MIIEAEKSQNMRKLSISVGLRPANNAAGTRAFEAHQGLHDHAVAVGLFCLSLGRLIGKPEGRAQQLTLQMRLANFQRLAE